MKVGDITEAVMGILGQNWRSMSEEEIVRAISDVQFVLDNPETTPAEWHKRVMPEVKYKDVKSGAKNIYKTILSTIKTLKGIQTGSDEKGDFVECDSVKVGEKVREKAIDWGDPKHGLATVSGDRTKPEGM